MHDPMRNGRRKEAQLDTRSKRFTLSFEHKILCILIFLSMIALFFACEIWLPQPLFVDVGREGDERYVEGFYQREGGEGFYYRWTADSSTIRFPDTGYMPVRISLAMDAARPEGQPPPNVTVTANKEMVADFVALNGIRTYEFDYFPYSFPFPGDLLLEIKTETFVPAGGSDSRALGVLVNTVKVKPYKSLSFPLLVASLEIALAGAFSVFLCYLVLQRMGIWRWGSLGLCGLLIASLVLDVTERFVASRLVLTLLPLLLLSSYGVVILVEFLVSLLKERGWRLRLAAALTSFKENLPNLLLAFAATLLTLLVIEIGFRVRAYLENEKTLHQVLKSELELPAEGPVSFAHLIRLSKNPRIIYELKPNISVIWEGNSVTLNEGGFRSESYPPQASEDTFRIVGIGDSVMFGMGVSDGEQYLAVLENQLNQAFPGRRWEVINTAVPGYNTVMEVETLKEKGLKYKPDIVIIGFVSNDLSLPNFIRREESPFTIQKSFLAEFLSERLGYSQHVDEPDPAFQKLGEIGLVRAPRRENDQHYEDDPSKVPPQYADMVGWDSCVKAMNELKSLQEQHGFDVIVIFLDPDDFTLKRQALELSEELGFHVVDAGPALRQYMEQHGIEKYKGSPLTVSEADRHPSALAHEIASEELFKYLTQERLIDV
jgi:hypothetical protein